MTWLELSNSFMTCPELLIFKRELGISTGRAIQAMITMYFWLFDNCQLRENCHGRSAYDISNVEYDILCQALELSSDYHEKIYDALSKANLIDENALLSDTRNIHIVDDD